MTQSDKIFFRTNHIDMKSHYLTQLKEDRAIELEHCPSNEMPADLFTKTLPKPAFQKLRDKLQIKIISFSDRGC